MSACRSIPYSPIIKLWVYRKEGFFWAYTRALKHYFVSRHIHCHKMLSFGQSSSKHPKTEIPKMPAIVHLQDERYWYLYSISVHANESSGEHCHSTLTPAYQTHTDGDRCSADTVLFILLMCVFQTYTWTLSFFLAESPDLLHMGVCLRMNTACFCCIVCLFVFLFMCILHAGCHH